MEKPLLYKVSVRIVNLAALFLTFLASVVSYGRCLSWMKAMIGVIQLLTFSTANIGISSILGCFYTSISKFALIPSSSDDASLDTSSAVIFRLLDLCEFHLVKFLSKMSRQPDIFLILSSFAS